MRRQDGLPVDWAARASLAPSAGRGRRCGIGPTSPGPANLP